MNSTRPSTFTQYRTLLAKDIRREFRTREMLTAMGIYAVLMLVVFGAALATTVAAFDILQMSGGLIWALIVFTSLLGLTRSFSYEKEEGALEALLLAPLDRSVIFLSKASSNLLFLAVVELIALPLFYFFFLTGSGLAPTFWMTLGPLIVGTVGIAGIGTLLATITMGTRGKDVLLAVLFIPLIFPLLYACVCATTVALLGSEMIMDTYVPSMALAIGYDVVMILVSWLLYDFVVSV
ncbi:MAG: heme exporter protein CcmB [Coriobacteriales bacterium]|nr:heme exporter protein CcmB [Coriobacteriales bacterium]